MEQEEQQVALYDFIYRDSARISSYYAQIFGGRLTTLEETDSARDTVDKSARMNVQVAAGDIKSSKENLAASKRTIDPHDIITTDVLVFLQGTGRLEADIDVAPHGSLMIASGTIVFVDRGVLSLADLVFELEIVAKRKAARTPAEKSEVAQLELVRKFLAKLDLPSGFLLQTQDGVQVAGTIKESGMEEPISTYYFKHGSAGLSDVYLIAIKEAPTYSFTLPNTQLIGAGQIAVQALADMLFPPQAIKVTPVALFRKL